MISWPLKNRSISSTGILSTSSSDIPSNFRRPILRNRKAQLGELVTKITMSIEHCYCSLISSHQPSCIYSPPRCWRSGIISPKPKSTIFSEGLTLATDENNHLSGRIEHGHGRLLKKYVIQSKAFRPAPTIFIAFTLLLHRLIEKELWLTILLIFLQRLAIDKLLNWRAIGTAAAAIIWIPNCCFFWIPPQ